MSRYAVVHNAPHCMEVAFFYEDDGTKNIGRLRMSKALLPNGQRPTKDRVIACHNCGQALHPKEMQFVRQDLEMSKPYTLIIVDAPMRVSQTFKQPGKADLVSLIKSMHRI